jgi:NAD(P)-dependent dehydrogenase (short-subunit alcohol dehydrogenase family)
LPTDVTQPNQVERLFAKSKERFGRLYVLFNNDACIGNPPVLLEDISYEEWQAIVFDTNVTGTFLCTQEAIRRMKVQNPTGGRIINNGSISARLTHSSRPNNSAPYTAGLTKSTNLDGRADWRIYCRQIDIGNATTSMAERMSQGTILQPNGQVVPEPSMNVQNVGPAIVYITNLPLEANDHS